MSAIDNIIGRERVFEIREGKPRQSKCDYWWKSEV